MRDLPGLWFLSQTIPKFAIHPGKNRVTNIFLCQGIIREFCLDNFFTFDVIKVSSLRGFLKWGIYLGCGTMLSDILTPLQNFQLVNIPLMGWVYPSKLRFLCDRSLEQFWWNHWGYFCNSLTLQYYCLGELPGDLESVALPCGGTIGDGCPRCLKLYQ